MQNSFILAHKTARERALNAVKHAPDGYQVIVKPSARTIDQNAKFHALCSDISKSGFKWAGKERTSAQWKVLLVSGHAIATSEGAEITLGLENEFVNLREFQSTELMSKKRGASLIEYTLAFCASNGIKLNDERF